MDSSIWMNISNKTYPRGSPKFCPGLPSQNLPASLPFLSSRVVQPSPLPSPLPQEQPKGTCEQPSQGIELSMAPTSLGTNPSPCNPPGFAQFACHLPALTSSPSLPSCILLLPHRPPRCSSNISGTFLPLGPCAVCSLLLFPQTSSQLPLSPPSGVGSNVAFPQRPFLTFLSKIAVLPPPLYHVLFPPPITLSVYLFCCLFVSLAAHP